MKRSGYRRTARAGVAVVGAVVLTLTTAACNDDDSDTGDTGNEQGADTPGAGDEDGQDGDASGPPEDDTDGASPDTDPKTDDSDTGSGADEDGADGEADRDAEGDASAGAGAAPDDDPYVMNFHGEENADGAPDQEPDALVLSEHTSLLDIEWETWDGEQAVGSGDLSGMWCIPECQEEPFEATVVLGDPEDVNGDTYYSVFELDAPDAEEYETPDLDGAQPLVQP